ncbi:septum formation initiator family protein [Paenisporosarcina macmurdoensis]|uniref:Septum formation initiator family protein n=1 Tax=Paenisporosarcina macmurdoensis TaxID=212659 RepID=A0ABW1L7Z9_9BACL|nr:septum formation initiator family protein [Paenisporosarcina sp.]
MGVNNRKNEENRNVSSINKDYVRSVERQEKREKAHKIRLFRRLSAFAVIVVLVMGWLTLTMFDKSQALAAKESKKSEVLQSLEQVQDEQDMLKSQILKLNDDDYIAKLARKEYFLSDDNEIIFAIPENEGNDDKNIDSKE